MAQKARRRHRPGEPVNMSHFEDKIVDEWPLPDGKRMRVSTTHFSGHDLLHIRRWRQGAKGQLFATNEGATIRIHHVPRLLKALRRVRAHARSIGLLPEAAKRQRSATRRGRK
jgi:hypothetical protein